MPVRFILFAVVTLGLISACSQSSSLPLNLATTTDTPSEPLSLQRLQPEPHSFSYYGGLTEPARLVIEDRDQWQRVWAQLWERTSESPSLPEIDFEQEVLIVAALGSRPSGGFSIFVDSAYHAGDHVSVVIRSVSPDRCLVTAAVTEPVDIARVPRTDLPVRFVERNELHVCE